PLPPPRPPRHGTDPPPPSSAPSPAPAPTAPAAAARGARPRTSGDAGEGTARRRPTAAPFQALQDAPLRAGTPCSGAAGDPPSPGYHRVRTGPPRAGGAADPSTAPEPRTGTAPRAGTGRWIDGEARLPSVGRSGLPAACPVVSRCDGLQARGGAGREGPPRAPGKPPEGPVMPGAIGPSTGREA